MQAAQAADQCPVNAEMLNKFRADVEAFAKSLPNQDDSRAAMGRDVMDGVDALTKIIPKDGRGSADMVKPLGDVIQKARDLMGEAPASAAQSAPGAPGAEASAAQAGSSQQVGSAADRVHKALQNIPDFEAPAPENAVAQQDAQPAAPAQPAGKYDLLRPGDKNPAVKDLQRQLNMDRRSRGLNALPETGYYGKRTQQAVQDFQKYYADKKDAAGTPLLPPDYRPGILDQSTWNAIKGLAPSEPVVDSPAKPAPAPLLAEQAQELTPKQLQKAFDKGGVVYFQGGLAVDTDGAGGHWRRDSKGAPTTSLTNPNGSYVDSAKIPYISVTRSFFNSHKLAIGDICAVVYNGGVFYAELADTGGKRLGEASLSVAAAVINRMDRQSRKETLSKKLWDKESVTPDDINPNKDGVHHGVTYIIFRGSGNGMGRSTEEIYQIGKKRYAEFTASSEN